MADTVPTQMVADDDLTGCCKSVLLRKTHVYRLCPSQRQAEVLSRWIGATRFAYNLALEQRHNWYRPGRRFNFASQCREVTALRAEVDWLRAVPVHALQQAMKDLERAYQNWWSGRAKAPTPRKRGRNDTIRFPDPATFSFRRLSRNVGAVKLPKLGWVRLRWDRKISGKVKSITISSRSGVWSVSAQYENKVPAPASSLSSAVGIDRGITVFAALSDGTLIAPANHGKKALKSLKRAQRKLARKKRGSANRKKQARRVARVLRRVTNSRRDFCHKISTDIAKNHGAVVLEKLQVRNMVRSAGSTVAAPGDKVRQKTGLNRAILDQGWGMFRTMLIWKMAERGGRLVEVPAANTSRTCAVCGLVDANSRNGQRFHCTACGHTAHADINAAINIKRRGDTALLPVEASRGRAIEAGTIRRAA